MAGNEVTLTFAGDAQQLSRAVGQAQAATTAMADSVEASAGQMEEGGQAGGRYSDSMARIGSVAAGMSAALGDASGTLTGLSDFMHRGEDRAREQARALLDVEQSSADLEQAYGDLRQAQVDLTQSMIDAKQAGIDVEQSQIDARQAALDATAAQGAYNDAVREHGAGSAEAQQAAIDLSQAQADLKQANLDGEQAQNDLKQATEDGTQAQRDAKQAAIDARGAQLDLSEAQQNANPGTLAQWGKELESVTPLIMGVIGATNLLMLANEMLSLSWIKQTAAQVGAKIATMASSVATGVATAAQWLWNVALTANPIGIIIVAIAALVAAIVWIATQTDWFSKGWAIAWGAIKSGAAAAWDFIVGGVKWLGDQITAIPGRIKAGFSALTSIITAPFRAGFNAVSDIWNSTIGRLSWSIPSWVPGVGGKSISAPKLPKFHSGGRVPGAPGQELLAVLQAGETVTPAGQSAGRTVIEIRGDGTRVADALVELLAGAIRRAGGLDVVLGGSGG